MVCLRNMLTRPLSFQVCIMALDQAFWFRELKNSGKRRKSFSFIQLRTPTPMLQLLPELQTVEADEVASTSNNVTDSNEKPRQLEVTLQFVFTSWVYAGESERTGLPSDPKQLLYLPQFVPNSARFWLAEWYCCKSPYFTVQLSRVASGKMELVCK